MLPVVRRRLTALPYRSRRRRYAVPSSAKVVGSDVTSAVASGKAAALRRPSVVGRQRSPPSSVRSQSFSGVVDTPSGRYPRLTSKSRQPLTSQGLYSGVVGVVSVVSYVPPCCDCVLWYICSALDIVRA